MKFFLSIVFNIFRLLKMLGMEDNEYEVSQLAVLHSFEIFART